MENKYLVLYWSLSHKFCGLIINPVNPNAFLYGYAISIHCNFLVVGSSKSTAFVHLWTYLIYSFIKRLYLLNYGVDVHHLNPRVKISLLHHRTFSSRVKHFGVFPEI